MVSVLNRNQERGTFQPTHRLVRMLIATIDPVIDSNQLYGLCAEAREQKGDQQSDTETRVNSRPLVTFTN
jgi:hypothetical protein